MSVVDTKNLRLLSGTTDSRLIVLLNGYFLTRTCPRNEPCTDSCRRSAGDVGTGVEPRAFNRLIEEAGSPEYRAAMSRAGGWTDAVIAIEPDGTADLVEVFRGNRPRPMRVRLCSTDSAVPCDGAYFPIAWDGHSAKATAPAFKPGLYRIVEDDDQSDAWVRLVTADRAAAIRTDYQHALEAVRGWSLPDSGTPLPSLDRLWRAILASVGETR
jgi:hypothetical protein